MEFLKNTPRCILSGQKGEECTLLKLSFCNLSLSVCIRPTPPSTRASESYVEYQKKANELEFSTPKVCKHFSNIWRTMQFCSTYHAMAAVSSTHIAPLVIPAIDAAQILSIHDTWTGCVCPSPIPSRHLRVGQSWVHSSQCFVRRGSSLEGEGPGWKLHDKKHEFSYQNFSHEFSQRSNRFVFADLNCAVPAGHPSCDVRLPVSLSDGSERKVGGGT